MPPGQRREGGESLVEVCHEGRRSALSRNATRESKEAYAYTKFHEGEECLLYECPERQEWLMHTRGRSASRMNVTGGDTAGPSKLGAGVHRVETNTRREGGMAVSNVPGVECFCARAETKGTDPERFPVAAVCACYVVFDAQAGIGIHPGVASDFIKPFVSRYGYPDLDQVRAALKKKKRCWPSFSLVSLGRR